jgi:hypothetical protein
VAASLRNVCGAQCSLRIRVPRVIIGFSVNDNKS